MAEIRSSRDLVSSISLSPEMPALREPTMVMLPTQNSREAVTNPWARETRAAPSMGWLERNLFSIQSPRDWIFPSRSSQVPTRAPSTMETMRTRVFSPCSMPSTPI